MRALIATLLATAAGASFAGAPTAALNHDPATYRNVTQKAFSEYRAAVAKCDSMSGNDKNVCMAEARLQRTRTEYEALAQYYNTPAGRAHARANLADAEFTLAKAKCDAKTGADKDNCVSNAKSVHTAALADAKAERTDSAAAGSSGSSAAGSSAAGAQESGSTAAENAADTTHANDSTAASKTRDAAATVADETKAVAATAAEKSKEVAQTAVEKTKQAASTVTQKTEHGLDRAGANTRETTETSAGKTRLAVSDTAITAKVKAGLVKVPKLDSLAVHVETDKGVVMLSGFVDSKAQADQAVQVAKGVDGVTSVKSAIEVK